MAIKPNQIAREGLSWAGFYASILRIIMPIVIGKRPAITGVLTNWYGSIFIQVLSHTLNTKYCATAIGYRPIIIDVAHNLCLNNLANAIENTQIIFSTQIKAVGFPPLTYCPASLQTQLFDCAPGYADKSPSTSSYNAALGLA